MPIALRERLLSSRSADFSSIFVLKTPAELSGSQNWVILLKTQPGWLINTPILTETYEKGKIRVLASPPNAFSAKVVCSPIKIRVIFSSKSSPSRGPISFPRQARELIFGNYALHTIVLEICQSRCAALMFSVFFLRVRENWRVLGL